MYHGRHKTVTSVGDHHCRLRKLQGRCQHVPLPDASTNSLTGEPCLSQRTSLPLGAGQYASLLSRRINPGRLTKSKGGERLCHRINAHAMSEIVIVGVARLGDGHSQINLFSVTGASHSQRPIPIAPIITGQLIPPWIRNRRFRRDIALGQRA